MEQIMKYSLLFILCIWLSIECHAMPNPDPDISEVTLLENSEGTTKLNRVKRGLFSFSGLWSPPTPACGNGQFQCGDGTCIAASWRCDEWDDCGDENGNQPSSDERNCANQACNNAKIRCTSTGACIPANWKCDGEEDCIDSSDEKHCGGCTASQFTCVSGQCIPANEECDGQSQCDDGSDETGCAIPQPACENGQFQCADGTCIEASWRCDEWDDCGDASGNHPSSDEIDCANHACSNDKIRCASTGACIPANWKCDGEGDCIDSSDENDCGSTVTGCTASEFTCVDGQCISASKKCDGQSQCGDGSDETGCPITAPVAPPVPQQGCRADEFTCVNGQCISENKRCDGTRQCNDFSDEINCQGGVCGDDKISCNGDNREPCIHITWWCDGGWPDCENRMDEENCAECPAPNLSCDGGQKCVHSKALCDGKDDCKDASDEPTFGEWGNWATKDGAQECPRACNSGSRYRSRSCTGTNCDMTCAKDGQKQERACPREHCFQEATEGPGTRSPLRAANRVTNGETSDKDDWPWQIQLYRDPYGNSGADGTLFFTCGGTLIDSNTVVTAAHCFTDKKTEPEYWVVHLGKFERSANIESSFIDGQMIWVKHLIIHEGYDDYSSDNDIAVLILGQKVPFTNTVNRVALNPIDPSKRKVFDANSDCYITGWGTLEEDGQLAYDLQEAHVPIWPRSFCEDALDPWITDNMLCAGHDSFGIDACQGDSGGPLVCLAEDDEGEVVDGKRLARWYLVGVTSWGIGCGRDGHPGVYARMDNYLGYVQNIIEEN